MTLWQWFTTAAPHTIISWALVFALSHTVLWLWAKAKLKRLAAEQRKHQLKVEAQLDTATPGGLGDVVRAIENQSVGRR